MNIDDVTFWIYDDLKGKVFLRQGHGWMGHLIKECSSYEEAAGLATDKARVLLAKAQANLDEIRRQVNAKPPKVLSFEQEIRAQFPRKDNAGVRRLLREASSSRQIRLMAKSCAFTELGREKLEIVAEAFDRPAKQSKRD
jgi:hypothetical protein